MILTPTTTLAEFAGNPDGKTYNGAKLAVFLVYASTGKQLSDEEGEAIVAEAKAKACRK